MPKFNHSQQEVKFWHGFKMHQLSRNTAIVYMEDYTLFCSEMY